MCTTYQARPNSTAPSKRRMSKMKMRANSTTTAPRSRALWIDRFALICVRPSSLADAGPAVGVDGT
jgi:hypothetical protein